MAENQSPYNYRAFPMPSANRVTRHEMPWYGQRLRELREKAGLTRDELADKVGVSARSIENWEIDRRAPNLEVALKLAKALGCSADEFVKRPRKIIRPKRGRPPRPTDRQ